MMEEPKLHPPNSGVIPTPLFERLLEAMAGTADAEDVAEWVHNAEDDYVVFLASGTSDEADRHIETLIEQYRKEADWRASHDLTNF